VQWQVVIISDEIPKKLREVNSTLVSKVFVVSGIIISTTKPYIKASKLKIKCKNCQLVKIIDLAPGQFPYVPSFCQGQNGIAQKCPNDPFVAMPDS
jgi:DNA replicative helicase MCM subunit Mcm2 (Cdc46/Mcm family)